MTATGADWQAPAESIRGPLAERLAIDPDNPAVECIRERVDAEGVVTLRDLAVALVGAGLLAAFGTLCAILAASGPRLTGPARTTA